MESRDPYMATAHDDDERVKLEQLETVDDLEQFLLSEQVPSLQRVLRCWML